MGQPNPGKPAAPELLCFFKLKCQGNFSHQNTNFKFDPLYKYSTCTLYRSIDLAKLTTPDNAQLSSKFQHQKQKLPIVDSAVREKKKELYQLQV